jgi:TolB protein
VVGRDGGNDEELHVLDLDGGIDRVVAAPPQTINESPTWVPGTDRLLFDSSRAGKIHLFATTAGDLSSVQQLTTLDGYQGVPSVSPDGRTVAFDNSDDNGTLGLSLLDLATGRVSVLVQPPGLPAFDSAPAFSPDGKRIAFIRKQSQQAPNAREAAFVVNADGTGLLQLTTFERDVCRIRWAPSGDRLFFSDKCENGTVTGAKDVWSIHSDGSAETQVTHNQAGSHTFDPEASPDGSTLIAVRWEAGTRNNTLWLIDLSGVPIRPVYASPPGSFIEWPAWSSARG